MTAKPRLLDLFCKAGGAGRGYADAGFDVVGVDIEPQPNYPFEFVQASAFDALAEEAFLAGFDAVHASPTCKTETTLKAFSAKHHVNQIPQTRRMLSALFDATGKPYVIENVPGAALLEPVVLCGSMFGLGVERHRLFELGGWVADQPACRHAEQAAASPWYPVKRYHSGQPQVVMSPVVGVYGRGQGLGEGEVELWRTAMGIDWMTRDELAQAIPPAYTRWLGERLIAHLEGRPSAQFEQGGLFDLRGVAS